MTEQQWLATQTPFQLVTYFQHGRLGGRTPAGRRKLRLLACACCRHAWHLLDDFPSRQAVEVSERLADRLAGPEDLKPLSRPLGRLCRSTWGQAPDPRRSAATAVLITAFQSPFRAALGAVQCVAAAEFGHELPPPGQARPLLELARDVLGNPFRSPALLPDWRTPAVLQLARAAYDERHLPAGTLDGPRLAVLADALEEAGCDQAELLGHLRGPGPHVRGCWALDAVLGKV